jgi:hypothetical protein
MTSTLLICPAHLLSFPNLSSLDWSVDRLPPTPLEQTLS